LLGSCSPPRRMPARTCLFEPAEDGAPHRKADVPDDQSRKPVGSLDAVGEVVGVEGDYPAHPVAEVEEAVSATVAPIDSPRCWTSPGSCAAPRTGADRRARPRRGHDDAERPPRGPRPDGLVEWEREMIGQRVREARRERQDPRPGAAERRVEPDGRRLRRDPRRGPGRARRRPVSFTLTPPGRRR
jgi:hypothetical protein